MVKKLYNGIEILHFDELESTNRTAMTADTSHLCVFVADRQSGGRGRLGRSFFSPNGGLYMSVVLEPDKIACGLPFCTAAAAVAVKDALLGFGISGLSVKWVNDILKDKKKVCGILTEARAQDGCTLRVVVGIGINLREPEGGFPDEIADRAGAVDFSGDKLALAADIAKRLGELICSPAKKITQLYSQSLAMIGEHAEVTDYRNGQKKLCGLILGVDENCFLRVRLDSGETVSISSGEIGQFRDDL